jgi:CubicO group peptidase (beta-lactamase class C family)
VSFAAKVLAARWGCHRRILRGTARLTGLLWAVAAVFLLSEPSLAQQPARALVQEDLAAWLDGYLPAALERGDVAGALVVVVKDGRVLLQKGFGYADVEARRAFDPESTLFRPGSVSKLVTWTAVMQQVEQGRIDLDRDVNTYLDFTIPPRAGQPVTMRNLMTHTGGFEQSFKDLLLTDPAQVVPLGQFLRSHVPARIFAPGEVPAYSNFGAALAGYIVQRVSGQSFDDYVERQIFEPLGIRHASFRQPLPVASRGQLAKGYQLASGPPSPYEIFPGPAGNAVFTGADMARFMIAHLQDGEFEGRRILKAETARLMHDSPLTIVSPAVNRMLLGFYESNRNGRRVIGHEGDTRVFHSILRLLPDENVGIFVVVNSAGLDDAGRAIRLDVSDAFIDRYFPRQTAQSTSVPESVAKAHAALLTGHYDSSQREESGYVSLLNLVMQAEVSTDAAGHILASPIVGVSGQPKPFEEIAPYVWGEVGGERRLAARVVDGKVVMWAADHDSPHQAYLPTPMWRSAAWLLPLLVASIAIILAMGVAWPIDALVRWRHGVHRLPDDRATRIYRWARPLALAAGLVMAAWLTTIGVMAATLIINSSLDPWIATLHVLSAVVFPLAALATAWHAWVVWRTRTGFRSAWAKAWSLALTVACLTLLWVAVGFHLIGTSLAS